MICLRFLQNFVWAFILALLIERVYASSFIIQFQGIYDFVEKNYFQTNFYPDIKAYTYYSIFGSYYHFCVEPLETCQYGYVEIDPPTFTHPVRAVLPLTLIRDALLRNSGEKIKVEFDPSYVYEIVPEFKEGVKEIPEKIIFDARLVNLDVIDGQTVKDTPDGRPCSEKFPHYIMARIDLEISASIGGGRDIFIRTSFSLPITVDIISWIPDVRYISGEMNLKRSTLYTVFGRCDYRIKPDFYYELDYVPRKVIENIKKKKESIQGVIDFDSRFFSILSYVIEIFLSRLDFKPIVFPILTLPLADIKKSYLVSAGNEKALALEFDDKGVIGLTVSPSIYAFRSPNNVISSRFTEIKIKGDSTTNKVSFSINGGVWSEWITKGADGYFSFVVSDLVQGVHTVAVIGQNIYGNINENPYIIGFFVDRTPPSLEIDISQYSNKIKGKIRVQDNSGMKVKVDMIVKRNNTEIKKKTYSFYGELDISEDVDEAGSYNLIFQAKDEAGNSGEVIQKTVIIDKVPPKIRIVNIPNQNINVDQINLLVEIEDDFFPYGIVNYFIEEVVSERRKTCFSQWGISQSKEIQEPYGYINISGLENGRKYHVCIRSSDPAGNSGDITEFEFLVDRTPPKIQINSFPPRITYDVNQYVEIYVQDNVSSYDKIQVLFSFSAPQFVSRAIKQGNSTNIFLDNLSDGRFKFSVYAIDEAGNVSNFEEREFIVDTSLKRLGGGGGLKLGCRSFDLSFYFVLLVFWIMIIKLIRPIANRRKGI
ncbi:MAG: Ig-like domain repeat protein [Candidatus Calescibacterium sp.]|nr:Ig-like domain repeat protein [Candidatus Calescibacterium sp.]MDW8086863.1 Ig-like domain repeat protein [Candidatus Calescibacterium sp.]